MLSTGRDSQLVVALVALVAFAVVPALEAFSTALAEDLASCSASQAERLRELHGRSPLPRIVRRALNARVKELVTQ